MLGRCDGSVSGELRGSSVRPSNGGLRVLYQRQQEYAVVDIDVGIGDGRCSGMPETRSLQPNAGYHFTLRYSTSASLHSLLSTLPVPRSALISKVYKVYKV